MKQLSMALVLIVFCAALAGCSGGGGGGPADGALTVPPAAGDATISPANAVAVSGEVVSATLGLVAVGDVLGTAPFAATNSGDVGQLLAGPRQTLGREHTKLLASATLLSATEISETVDCLFGGEVSVSADLADVTAVTVGDAYRSEFDDCDEGAAGEFDGGLDFVVTEFVGDIDELLFGGRFRLGSELTLDDFEVTVGGITTTQDGDFTIVVDTLTPQRTRVEVSGDRLLTREGAEEFELRNFASISTVDESQFPALFTLESRGLLASSSVGGDVTFTTPVPFQGFGDEFPFTGEQLTVGANGTSVRLIALDNTNVRLEVDGDGDGAVDETIDTTWENLTVF